MTATTAAPAADTRHVTVVSHKAPIALAAITVLFGILIALAPRVGLTNFRFATDGDLIALPGAALPGTTTAWVCIGIAALLSLGAAALTRAARKVPIWLTALFAVVLLFGFLAWSGAGSQADFPVSRLIGASVLLAVPLVFGALGGVIGERAGVVNIAIEAQLLAGAFTAAIAGSLTDSPVVGLLAAVAAGMLVALVLGVFTITYRVDQIIVGVVLNVLVVGLTSFFYSEVLVPNAAAARTRPTGSGPSRSPGCPRSR